MGGLLSHLACGSEVVVHNLEEREANLIIELLADNDVSAQKGIKDDGRTVTYTIAVPSKSRLDAIRALNHNEMPRRRDMGYNQVFKDGGLIPTASEERAKHLAALEGEIEIQLKLVDGLLDAQVQLVQPEENALRTAQDIRTPTTASVTVKYLPGSGGAKPLSEPQVQAIVAAGVERLTPDNVVVVMTPAGGRNRNRGGGGGGDGDDNAHLAGLRGLSARQASTIAIVLISVILLLALGMGVAQMRLRTVRGRLLRLQTEIARARRKPGEGPPGVGAP